MTDVPAFEVPMTDEYVDALINSEGTDTEPSEDIPLADPGLVTAVKSGLPSDATVEVHSAETGRGAEGYAAVLELLGVLASVGGTIAFGKEAYKVVKRTYDAIAQRLGSPPCVSLGAARFLAMAHLASHLGSDDIDLVASGDLSEAPPDFSFSGFDNFWVALRYEDRLYNYVVDARGRPYLVGDVPFIRTKPLGYRTVVAENTNSDDQESGDDE